MNNIKFDFTFLPQWWHKYAGVEFVEDFFVDYKFRIEQDIIMRKTLYKYFGDLGFGDAIPSPRPIIDTEFVAGEYLQALIFGCETRYFADAYPEIISKNISDDELSNLQVPVLDENKHWKDIERQMRALTEEYGYVESYLDLHGVQNLALSIRGQQLFIDYYEKPELVKKLLYVCTELVINVAKRVKQYSKVLGAGVTSILKQVNPEMYITSNCTVDMISSDIYERFLLECDAKIAKEFEYFGVHHCGRHTERFAENYKKIPNVSFVEVGAFSDIKKVREEFKDTHLNLRYSPIRLKEASKDDIKSDISKMILEGGPIEKISVSCVGIDADTPIENIKNYIGVMQEIEY